MATVFSHPAVVLGLSPWFRSLGVWRRVALFGILCAVLPDADAIGFWLGVPYASVWGHRGLTHSILSAALVAAVITAGAFGAERSRIAIFSFLFLCGVSHGLFDAMTDGGLGVAFFAPFDRGRYFFPSRPIRVSPIGVHGFFGRRGLSILESELVWIWLPCLALGAAGIVWRRRRIVGQTRWK